MSDIKAKFAALQRRLFRDPRKGTGPVYVGTMALLQSQYEETGNAVFAYEALRWSMHADDPPPQWCRDVVLPALDELGVLAYREASVSDTDIIKALGLKANTHPSLLRRAGDVYRHLGAALLWEQPGGKEIVRRSVRPPKQRASRRDGWSYDSEDARNRAVFRAVRHGCDIRAKTQVLLEGGKRRK